MPLKWTSSDKMPHCQASGVFRALSSLQGIPWLSLILAQKQTHKQYGNILISFFPIYITFLILHWQLADLLRHGTGQYPETSLVSEEEHCEISKKDPF